MTPSPALGRDRRWWPAPAKLNLFLHVTGRRADGYHELQTLFQLLDWGDEVYVEVTDDGEIVRRDAVYDIPPENDLAIRAAERLRAAAGAGRGARIEVNKRIPPGAGLGGGSSDAATVLVVLNRLWNCGLDLGALAGLGLELGADVPLFVRGNSAMATGIGEKLESVSLGRRHYLLVLPDLAISTAEIFGDPELKRNSALLTRERALGSAGRNDCEPVVRRRYPGLSLLMNALSKLGEVRMSGTGSALFIPMPSREAAIDAEKRAAKAAKTGSASKTKCRYNVRAVGGLDHSPLHRALT